MHFRGRLPLKSMENSTGGGDGVDGEDGVLGVKAMEEPTKRTIREKASDGKSHDVVMLEGDA